jgi:hypothetical protein
MINLELNLQQAAVVRQALFVEQKGYTLDPTCIPPRIVDIRNIIVTLDKKIDDALEYETHGK